MPLGSQAFLSSFPISRANLSWLIELRPRSRFPGSTAPTQRVSPSVPHPCRRSRPALNIKRLTALPNASSRASTRSKYYVPLDFAKLPRPPPHIAIAVAMAQSPPNPPDSEPLYGGFSRFEVELEVSVSCLRDPVPSVPVARVLTRRPAQFVQSLASPFYLNHLASQKLLSDPAFVEYLKYLQYWSKPPYLKYLTYPGPTLKHLELLQQEKFRQDIISPELMQALAIEGQKASIDWHKPE